MNKLVRELLIFFSGVFACGLVTVMAMPVLMFQVTPSVYGFEETVAQVESQIDEAGWVNSGISYLDKSVKKHGRGDIPKTAVIKTCHPDYAKAILSVDGYRHLSAMMPCSVAVFEKGGAVYVSHFNTGLMGLMFGEPVRDIMAGPVKVFLADVDQAVARR